MMDAHTRRSVYRSLHDDERRQLLEAAEDVGVVQELVDGRFATDCWREEAAERRFWYAMVWALLLGCIGSHLILLFVWAHLGG